MKGFTHSGLEQAIGELISKGTTYDQISSAKTETGHVWSINIALDATTTVTYNYTTLCSRENDLALVKVILDTVNV